MLALVRREHAPCIGAEHELFGDRFADDDLAAVQIDVLKAQREQLALARAGARGYGGAMSIDINGIAHIQLSVTDMERSRPFYRRLLVEGFGMRVQYDAPEVFYCIGARTGLLITPVSDERRGESFDQRRAGLHHLCFRARSAESVDEVHALLVDMGARVVHGPETGQWAPGYYSVLFEDPDGIRLEVNFVPGRGNLDRIADGPLGRPA
jgi:catechol 2,3-dioxygenase-like lactoylglutathione lyase family enzyme